MGKILTSYHKLSNELKAIVDQKFPKETLAKHLVKISQDDYEATFGVILQYEKNEYLIKMITTPVNTIINIDAFIEELDKPND